VTVGSHDSD